MKTYVYNAIDTKGNKISGKLVSTNKQDVIQLLQSQSYTVTHVEEFVDLSFTNVKNFQIGKIPVNEKVIFVKQLYVMLSSGIPISTAIESLQSQVKSSRFKSELDKIYDLIKNGESVYNSFSKSSSIFDEVQLNLIKAGEKSGNLVEMMRKISEDLERNKNFVSKVKGALIYPVTVLTISLVVLWLLLVFLIPSIESLFIELNALDKVPQITKIMITLSKVLNPANTFSFILVILGLSVIGIGSYLYLKTENGKRNYDIYYSKIPVIGELAIKLDLAQFCRILSMLLSSGVNISESLKITSGAVSNTIMKESVLKIIPEIEKGGTIAGAMNSQPMFTKVLVRMVATGELSGNLDNILNQMAQFYEDEVNNLTQNFTKLLEPMVLLFVGGIVAILTISVYLPIYQVSQVIK